MESAAYWDVLVIFINSVMIISIFMHREGAHLKRNVHRCCFIEFGVKFIRPL